MSSGDFGIRKAARPAPVWLYVMIAAVVFGAAVALISIMSHRSRDLAQAKAWDINAAPCPEVSAAAFKAQPVKLKHEFEYEGMTVSRAFGHADCDMVSMGGWKTFIKYPSCQLTGPGVMIIAAKGRTHYFLPGFGERTTISLRDGKLTCVLDGNFGKPREG